MAEEWVIDIRDQCHAKRVPFFFKQWGGVQKKRAGRLLQGKTWDEMPALPRLATVIISTGQAHHLSRFSCWI